MKTLILSLGLLAANAMLSPTSARANCEQAQDPELANKPWLNQYFNEYAPLTAATTSELRLLKNEIFARHGYVFKSVDLQGYFSKQPWYKPNPDFRESSLTSKERDALERVIMMPRVVFLNPSDKTDAGMISKPVAIDLAGDGRKEKIWVTWSQERERISTLHIDQITEEVQGVVYIVDIDTSDRIKEIAVSDMDEGGGSTVFYRYDGNQLASIGNISGMITTDVVLNGSGIIKTVGFGRILHTWNRPWIYKLDSNHELVPVESASYPMHEVLTMLGKLPLQKSPTDASTVIEMLPGQKLRLLSTDDVQWVAAESTTGVKGWFSVSKFTITATNQQSGDLFDGLCFAN